MYHSICVHYESKIEARNWSWAKETALAPGGSGYETLIGWKRTPDLTYSYANVMLPCRAATGGEQDPWALSAQVPGRAHCAGAEEESRSADWSRGGQAAGRRPRAGAYDGGSQGLTTKLAF